MGLINFIPSLKCFHWLQDLLLCAAHFCTTRSDSGWWRALTQLVYCHISKIPKMEEILKRIVTVRKTILICFHLYYLRLLASELAMKSSFEKDSFLIFVCVCV